MEEIKSNSIEALKEMDEDGDDAITLEEFMERTGLIWADERIKKKYRGVHQQKSGRWGAVIRDGIKTKSIWLGTYHTAEDAATAYDRASFRLKGTKASLNFPQTHLLSTIPDNDSPIIQHLFDSQDNHSPVHTFSGVDRAYSIFEAQPVLGIQSHNNLEVESEKLEDSPRKIHVDATYSASHVSPEEGNVAPNPAEDRINAMKGPVEGDKINISFHDLEKHFGKPLDVAAENIGVSRSTIKRICRKKGIFRWPFHKRNKHSQFCYSQQGVDGPTRTPSRSPYLNNCTVRSDATIEDYGIVIIKASYEDTMIKFQLCITSKLSDLEKEVAKRLNLKVGGFKMVYEDEDNDFITILCDADLNFCFKSLTSPGKDTVRMIVKPHFHKE